MASVFEFDNKIDREFGREHIGKINLNALNDELRSLLSWQMKYIKEIASVYDSGDGLIDKLTIFGNPIKFDERKEKPSDVRIEEIHDAEEAVNLLKAKEYEIVGGLGGFSFDNGKSAGELIMLPGSTTIRAELRGKQYFAQNVPLRNIYPMLLMTGRKKTQAHNTMFFVVLEKGETMNSAIQEVAARIKDNKKTITGTIMGSFVNMSGYIFTSASPKTVLHELEIGEKRNLFVYQTFLGEGIEGFPRKVHGHGFEAARVMDRNAFGAHLYDAVVADCAIGIFGIAGEIERY